MRVLGVLGGRSARSEVLLAWADAADALYAADSGADSLVALGLSPAVVGDLDSARSDLSALRVVHDPDPDRTDCDKLVALIHQEHPNPDVVIAAYEGDRIDHMLGSLSSLARAPFPLRILLDTGIGYLLHAPARLDLPKIEGQTVSLLPLSQCIASLHNCDWPLEKATLEFPGFQSLSNVARAGFQAELHQGRALLVVTGPVRPW